MADGDNSATQAMDPNTLAALLQQTMTPNPAVQQENAPNTDYLGTAQLQPPAPVQQPQVSSTPPPSNVPPRMGGMPLIAQYIQGMIKGGNQGGIGPSGYPMQPTSRGDMTLNFLSQFLGNLAQGLSQAGHGPGANLRGFGAAVQAPYQRSLQDFQVQQQAQQQQAQLGLEQARTQAQVAAYTAQPRFDPQTRQFLGVMTDAQYTQYLRGQGAAQVSGEARKETATIGAQAKYGVAQLQILAAQGQIARVFPDVDPNGQQFYHLMNKFGKEIGRADVNAIPQFMQRTSNTIDWKDDGQGGFQALPKPTVSGPVLPGAAGRTPAATPSGGGGPTRYPSPSSSKWALWLNPETGAQEAGPMSVAPKGSNPAQLQGAEIKDIINARHGVQLMTKQGDPSKPETQGVLQLIDSLDKDGKLGVLASRWNKFMTTGFGSEPGDDPRIVTLIDKNMLSDTNTMLAHFGASGGRSPQMLQHFLDLANAGKMDADTLRAGTKAIADYMKDRAMQPASQQSNIPKASGGGSSKFDDLVRKYGGKKQ